MSGLRRGRQASLNRTISVVTAVHGPSIPYLVEAMSSISRQSLPDGWFCEWLIQCDGPQEIPNAVTAQQWCSVGVNRRSGPAVARNMALARSTGEVVKNLDADDLLADGALWRDITTLLEHPDVGWTAAPAVDLLEDDELQGDSKQLSASGRVPPGWMVEEWHQCRWRKLPVVPGTLAVRRELLTQLGGWMALPTSEDTGLLMALSTVSAGFIHSECGMYYRKHPGQTTRQPEHHDREQMALRRRLILARVAALQCSSTLS